MEHPLEDCRLKVARAKEQFNALHDEIVRFSEDNPYVVDVQVDPETGDEIFESAEPPRFPRRWATLVGEIAHNLRSSLDQLVAVFIREAGREPDGNNAFPISKTKDRYLVRNKRGLSYRDRLLRQVPNHIKQRIDALQPYQRGNLAYADALIALRHMSDRDKHREPQTAYAWITTPTKAFSFPTDDEMRNLKIRLPRKGGVDVQADFKRGRGKPAAIVVYPDVKVQREPGVEVVFGRDPDKLVGLDDLRGMIGYVETIIESFAADFKP
ncbi:MAG: hypothetical protein QOH58_1669 [Thermoleophilaceae bacterium]|nr:hypothetical protein [Thermoleophilaceae bacterium]